MYVVLFDDCWLERSTTHTLIWLTSAARRYDDMKSAGENIELQTTILSRFDLIFIVKDERNADRDRQIAKCAPIPAAISCKPSCSPSRECIFPSMHGERSQSFRRDRRAWRQPPPHVRSCK